jgi:hypothetical protein
VPPLCFGDAVCENWLDPSFHGEELSLKIEYISKCYGIGVTFINYIIQNSLLPNHFLLVACPNSVLFQLIMLVMHKLLPKFLLIEKPFMHVTNSVLSDLRPV